MFLTRFFSTREIVFIGYLFPDSVFGYLAARIVALVVGGPAIVYALGLLIANVMWFVPGTTQYNIVSKTDAIYAQGVEISLNQVDSYGRDVILGKTRTQGYPFTFDFINNTDKVQSSPSIEMVKFECQDKPKYWSGPMEPANCVRTDDKDYIITNEDISIEPHTTKEFSILTNMYFDDHSHGKYPYLFMRMRIDKTVETKKDAPRPHVQTYQEQFQQEYDK